MLNYPVVGGASNDNYIGGLGRRIQLRPSFVVVADTRLNMACETAARHTELGQALARDYEKIKTVTGKWDSFTIYRRKQAR